MRAFVVALCMAGVAHAAEWRDITPPGVPWVQRVLVHPTQPSRLFLLGEASYTSRDLGATWSASSLGHSAETIFVHPGRPGSIYVQERWFRSRFVVGGGRLSRSDDFGQTWRALSPEVRASSGTAVSVFGSDPRDAERLLGVQKPAGDSLPPFGPDSREFPVMESRDGALTWIAISSHGARRLAPPTPAQPDLLLNSRGNRIEVSRDGGRTFAPATTPHGEVLLAAADPAVARRLYAFTLRPGEPVNDLWRSDDEGGAWKLVVSLQRAGGPVLHLSHAVPGRLLVAGQKEGIVMSEDAGESWKLLGLACDPCDFHPRDVTYSPADPYRLFAIASTRLYTLELPRPATAHSAEYYVPATDRYWMSANRGEEEMLAYGASPGAVATGERVPFFAAGTGKEPVCRFQGRAALGYHSRFLTLDGGECDAIEASGNFELQGFGELEAAAPFEGSCAWGMPIHRFLKPGADVNHRYVLASQRDAMRERGWSDEGVVMCGPP